MEQNIAVSNPFCRDAGQTSSSPQSVDCSQHSDLPLDLTMHEHSLCSADGSTLYNRPAVHQSENVLKPKFFNTTSGTLDRSPPYFPIQPQMQITFDPHILDHSRGSKIYNRTTFCCILQACIT